MEEEEEKKKTSGWQMVDAWIMDTAARKNKISHRIIQKTWAEIYEGIVRVFLFHNETKYRVQFFCFLFIFLSIVPKRWNIEDEENYGFQFVICFSY